MYKKLSHSFLRSRSGGTAVTFALCLIPVIGLAGLAIDFSMMERERHAIQHIADSAVLAAASSGEKMDEDLKKVAQEYADSHGRFSKFEFKRVGPDTIEVHLDVAYDPVLMNVFGFGEQDISVMSQSLLPQAAPLNLALVLDTTVSMRGERMDSLKKAAVELIEAVEAADNGEGNARISLIPFAENVRLDPDRHRNMPWLDVPAPYVHHWTDIDLAASTNCRRIQGTEGGMWTCDVEVRKNHTGTWHFEGCVASRRNGLHKVPDYQGSKIYGFAYGPYGACRDYTQSSMVELTDDFQKLKDVAKNLIDGGYTYMPAGLIWGWRVLDPDEPFKSDPDTMAGARNVLLLMSDGANSNYMDERDRYSFLGYYHTIDSKESPQYEREAQVIADKLTRELCQGIKDAGIRIITVAFEVDDRDTLGLLRECASKEADAYNVDSTSELTLVFDDIGSGLDERVRLTK